MTDSLTFHALRIANIARQAEWPGGEYVDLAFRGLELAGEIGEATDAVVDLLSISAASGRLANKLKKITRLDRGIKGTTEERAVLLKEVMAELADVVICVDLVAMQLDVSLQQAVRGKFNATSLKHSLRTRLT